MVLNGSDNPNKSQISHHLECLNRLLDEYSKKYKNYNQNYKNYNNDTCRSEIQSFCSLSKLDLGLFKELIFCIFKEHAPIRKISSCKRSPFHD